MPDISSDVQSEAEALLGSIEEVLEGAAWDIEAETNALLESVQEVVERDARYAEERRLRGEDFNVFEILGITKDEDRLHSRFIAHLLDPGGSHGQGDAFLHLFLSQVGKGDWVSSQGARVEREFHIGEECFRGLDEEDSTGGRIDIVIADDHRYLSIENKIGSGQRRKQITRYCNYKPERNHVLFLTLHGHKANTTKENYSSISYSNDILSWLKKCYKHTSGSLRLQEIIQQYTAIVKRLTGRLTMKDNQKKLLAAMRQRPAAALAIYQNFDAFLQTIVAELVSAVQEEVVQRSAWRPTPMDALHDKWGGLQFNSPHSDEVSVKWEGHGYITKASYFGIKAEQGAEQRTRIKDALTQHQEFRGRETEGWPIVMDLTEARFSTPGPLENLLDDAKRTELAHQIAEKLIGLIQFCDSVLGAGGDAA